MNLPANQFELPEEHSNLSRMFFKYMNRGGSETMYWATVPLLSDKKNPSGDSNQALESWKRWNSFRLQNTFSSMKIFFRFGHPNITPQHK